LLIVHLQNPTDWKHEAFFSPKDAIIGCDYAGTVVKLGNNLASPLQVGDKVAGWVHGGLFPNKGSYAEYAKQESDLLFKVPESISLKEASHFGCAWITALQVSGHLESLKCVRLTATRRSSCTTRRTTSLQLKSMPTPG
jgi:NADPH:quinone reductase-like Zn-dependent oxidoreductase